jgi:hypothetical protein
VKVRYAAREWLRTLCLLSTFVPASRCRRTNDAALSSEGHFFVVACYFFEGGFTRPTFILERQRRIPTKGRIHLFKSSTKDLSLPIFELVFQHRLTPVLPVAKCRSNVMILDDPEDRRIRACFPVAGGTWDTLNGNLCHFAYATITLYGRPFQTFWLWHRFIKPTPAGRQGKGIPRHRARNVRPLDTCFGLGCSAFDRLY